MLGVLGTENYEDVVIRAVLTLALAAFLHVREFTYRQTDIETGPPFRSWFLTKSSIQLQNWKGESYIKLTLLASKTDPFRHGIELTIAASNDLGCPVRAMKRFARIDTHRPQLAPLFCVGRDEQRPLTREYVVHKLQDLAIRSGLGRGA